MTTRSQPLDFAVSIIAAAGCAFGTCKRSADIPICSAIARASSSTLPACSLQAASKRSTSSCVGIHIIGDGGSVTLMTVTLAFKAFAKASPCLTPFVATSDPSVLKRILAYIPGLPCSSNISGAGEYGWDRGRCPWLGWPIDRGTSCRERRNGAGCIFASTESQAAWRDGGVPPEGRESNDRHWAIGYDRPMTDAIDLNHLARQLERARGDPGPA